MTLGEKIKNIRLSKKLTQSDLCASKITRNMLSAIESGKANPSLDTLRYISDALDIPLPYLLSEEEDLFFYEKKSRIEDIKKYFKEKRYKQCIDKILECSSLDDELSYLIALCHYELGRAFVINGSLASGKIHLDEFNKYAKSTVYDTAAQRNSSLLYCALIANIQSPLLELDCKTFEKGISEDFEYGFYKYISSDKSYEYKDARYKMHLEARELIKNRRYKEALTLLVDLLEGPSRGAYNAYLIFAVYSDIEQCYKQLFDFENAYRYASKRLSIIEGFKL